MSPPPRLRCRTITAADAPAVIGLLVKGFPTRTTAFWQQAVGRLMDHAAQLSGPAGGVLLESDGAAVGVLLTIFASPQGEGSSQRCNLSSWYVEPAFQAYAPLMVGQALRRKDITYFNISPATHTWPTIEAQGFRRYSRGRVLAVPALGPPTSAKVRRFDLHMDGPMLEDGERDLIARHERYGCLALSVVAGGSLRPFLFLPRRLKGVLPIAQLIYTRSIGEFIDLSGPIGRFLLRRGRAVVSIDADGPIAGLTGGFITDRRPKYFKGPVAPRLGDMTDTELVLFGP